MIKEVLINDIYGELICKIDESQFPLLEQQGKYPRIQWISIDGRKLSKRLVKTEIVSIIDTPHYKFVQNDIISYQEYMNKNKPDCDHCGIELTVGDHPSCCSNCWEENAKYYE